MFLVAWYSLGTLNSISNAVESSRHGRWWWWSDGLVTKHHNGWERIIRTKKNVQLEGQLVSDWISAWIYTSSAVIDKMNMLWRKKHWGIGAEHTSMWTVHTVRDSVCRIQLQVPGFIWVFSWLDVASDDLFYVANLHLCNITTLHILPWLPLLQLTHVGSHHNKTVRKTSTAGEWDCRPFNWTVRYLWTKNWMELSSWRSQKDWVSRQTWQPHY